MSIIVLEGPDNSGKSTLAQYIASRTGLSIVESEGPPKYPGEIAHRISRYNNMKNVLFVRHPVISQMIYGVLRGEHDDVPYHEVFAFYNARPIIIYCDSMGRGLQGHVEKPNEMKEHLEELKRNHRQLLIAYRDWAIVHANIIYRIGDSMERVYEAVRHAC